jgi:hypothetical protein
MTLAVWMLVLAVFLSGAVTGVFVMLVIGIHIGGRSHHLTDEPDAHLDALTRSTLGRRRTHQLPRRQSPRRRSMTNAYSQSA